MTQLQILKLPLEQQEEVANAQATENRTKRAISEGAEKHMHVPYQCLDHGMVKLVDYMGNDAAVVQGARVSYGKGTKAINEDKGLINYLLRNLHTTPFELCEIKLHVKMPVFVARQWIRHRTANVNEYSARYSILDGEFYVPETQHVAPQSASNAQGREADGFSETDIKFIQEFIEEHGEETYQKYLMLLAEPNTYNEEEFDLEVGLARELSRMILPMNIYTQMYWKIDVHNLMHFLKLRADSHAQYEIRVFANTMCAILQDWMPHTYEAFENYIKDANSISKQGTDFLVSLLDNLSSKSDFDSIVHATFAEYNFSKSEKADLEAMLRLPSAGNQ